MSPIGNATLGLLFLGLAFAATFLMYHLWGYPFDEKRKRSEAPPRLIRIHRLVGYAFVAIYVIMMWQMVPRLWTYQVELPARTVAHLLLGMTIGVILIVKIVIVRFFKHMESKLVPGLGTGLLICTVLLMGLALPAGIRETLLLRNARAGGAFSAERIERVRDLLPLAGLEDARLLTSLASEEGLISGRGVLRTKCTQCHDLRTILARPRTPDEWRQTVRRMAERSQVLDVIREDEQWMVTAYLIAVTPTLQATVRLQREQRRQTTAAMEAVRRAGARGMQVPYDETAAMATFESRCSQCHALDSVERNPPTGGEAALALVERMVMNGLVATEEDLAQIVRYLTETYPGAGEPETTGDSSEPVGEAQSAIPTDPTQLFEFLSEGSYRSWAHEAMRHPSLGPHPAAVQVFVNQALAASIASGIDVHPQGSSAVKELFDEDGELGGWAVSSKTRPSSEEGNGWFWYEVLGVEPGLAPIAAGEGVELCTGCHAAGNDFVLIDFVPGS